MGPEIDAIKDLQDLIHELEGYAHPPASMPYYILGLKDAYKILTRDRRAWTSERPFMWGIDYWVTCQKIGDLKCTSGVVYNITEEGVFIMEHKDGQGSSYFKYNEIVAYGPKAGWVNEGLR